MAKTTGKTGGSGRGKRPIYQKQEKKPKQKVRAAVARAGRMLVGESAPAKSSKPVSKIPDRAIRTTLRYEQNKAKPDHTRIDKLKKRYKSRFKK